MRLNAVQCHISYAQDLIVFLKHLLLDEMAALFSPVINASFSQFNVFHILYSIHHRNAELPFLESGRICLLSPILSHSTTAYFPTQTILHPAGWVFRLLDQFVANNASFAVTTSDQTQIKAQWSSDKSTSLSIWRRYASIITSYIWSRPRDIDLSKSETAHHQTSSSCALFKNLQYSSNCHIVCNSLKCKTNKTLKIWECFAN